MSPRADAPRALRLVVVAGLVASGKSTLAARIAAETGAELLSADAIRQALHQAGARDAMTPGFSGEVYRVLLERARGALAAGRSVVLDGSFRTRTRRRAARELARELGAEFRLVECRVDPELCRARLRERERCTGGSGWLSIFEHFLEGWEALDELPERDRIEIDTSGAPEALGFALRDAGLIPSP